MSATIKTVSAGDLTAVVEILNASSAGHSFEFRLDLAKYLMLSRFVNFSYSHSYIAYSGNVPAGVILNCTDAAEREAYSFYWGMLPAFRGRTLSLRLLYTYLDQIRDEGFRVTHADSSPDSPFPMYQRMGYRRQYTLFELRAERAPGNGADAETIEMAELFAAPPFAPDARSWLARPNFLHTAAGFLEILASRDAKTFDAYLALSRWTGYTSIVALDFREGSDASAARLVAALSRYPAPYSATHVVGGSRAERLLRSCGFRTEREWMSISLDLDVYASSRR